MKSLLLLALCLSAFVAASGCGDPPPLPDQSNVKRQLPADGKTKDVLLPINK